MSLASRFARFSEQECEFSPLYRRLTAAIAQDEEILRLTEPGEAGPKPNMLLAAVHYLLLRGERHSLADWYPSCTGRGLPDSDPYPAFREFALRHQPEIRSLLETRRVQTNEVARCSILLPAFGQIAQQTGRSLGLVEVGASAGLLLSFDRYGYRYSDGRECGPSGNPLQLTCSLRGNGVAPIPEEVPRVGARVGLDLSPVDLGDSEQALWLQALVWPDQPVRLQRLRRAIAVSTDAPPRLVPGDALQTLGEALSRLPTDVAPVVFHCHTLNQFPAGARGRFYALLAALSGTRDLWHLAAEATAGEQYPLLTRSLYRNGDLAEQRILARYQAHGEWLQWSE